MEKNDITKSRILDKIKSYEKSGEIVSTAFLDPREIIEYESLYRKIPHYLDGGFDSAERKILVLGLAAIIFFISLIEVSFIFHLTNRRGSGIISVALV